MVKEDKLEFEGVVVDSTKGLFRVKINENILMMCTLSGKIRENGIRIIPGDVVTCECSVYDASKGRITFRKKAHTA